MLGKFIVAFVLFLPSVVFAQMTCREINENNLTIMRDSCAVVTCANGYPDECTEVSIEPKTTEPGIFALYNYSPCVGTGPLWKHGSRLQDCSANEGRSIGKRSFSSVLKPLKQCGSIVRVEEQALGERIPIVGASFDLLYTSTFALGTARNFKASITLTGPTLEPEVLSFGVLVEANGITPSSQSYSNNTVNRVHDINWDGKNSSGFDVQGYKIFTITVTEKLASHDFPVFSRVVLGGFRSKLIGLGGWAPSVFKYYDSGTNKLVSMDGDVSEVRAKDFATGQVYVASSDGAEVYIFDGTGRHLFTKTGLTGATKYSFNYDGVGRLISIVEPFGRTTTFDRNLAGDLVSITAPKGQITAATLDTNGYLASLESPNSATYVMTSSASGLLESFYKPGSQGNTFTYDADGKLITDSHTSGYFFDLVRNASTFNHDISMTTTMGRVSRVQSTSSESGTARNYLNASGVNRSYSYNLFEGGIDEAQSVGNVNVNVRSFNDPRFVGMANYPSVTNVYAPTFSRQSVTTVSATLADPDDPFSVASLSSISQITGANTSVTTVFNPSTKVFSTSTYLGKTQNVSIDSYERPISVQTGTLTAVDLAYTNENLTSIVQGSRVTSLSYNATSGFLESIVNPLSQTISFVRDSVGNVVSKILPDSRVIGFGYDLNGNLTSVTPPSRPTHYFTLNSAENVSNYAPPALTGVSLVSTSYTYNLDKQLTQIARPDGAVIDYTYNATTGVLESYTTPDGTYNQALDVANGLPSTITKPDGGIMYLSYSGTTLTGTTRYNSTWSQADSYSKTFNSEGNIGSDAVSSETGTSTINYAYNHDEDLSTAGSLTLNYNVPNGQLTGTTLGAGTSGFTDAYTYNAFGEVTAYQAKRGTTVLYSLGLTRDGSGRISGKTQTMNSVSNAFDYVFDSAGRLTQVSKNSVVVSNYGYDGNSNRNSGNIGAQSTSATYDDQDRLSTYNTLSFTYNANGDLQTKTNATTSTTTTYVYDVFGNLTSVTLPTGTVITYEIDALNRRVAKSVNGVLQKRWIYMDQYRIAAELNATGTITKRFIYGSKGNIPDYMVASGVTYRIISDHLGSPRLVVRQSNGAIQQRMDHDEYGRVTEDTSPGYLPFGFAGGLYDHQTDLVRFGARDFDPEAGRWTSKDPILFNGGDTNLFGYVANDPINWMDTEGLEKIKYNGSLLRVYSDDGKLLGSFSATSGNASSARTPQGLYSVDLSGLSFLNYWNPAYLIRQRAGDWGRLRVPIQSQFSQSRSGFYIHGGVIPGSAGCIDVGKGGAEKALFNLLDDARRGGRATTLEVEY